MFHVKHKLILSIGLIVHFFMSKKMAVLSIKDYKKVTFYGSGMLQYFVIL